MLHPESLILEDELIPVLLTAPEAEFEAAITLFDPDQLDQIRTTATALLHKQVPDREIHAALWDRMQMIGPHAIQ